MQITNGQIEYEHPHKVADFQIPKAKVTLSFVLDPAEDADVAVARVAEIARSRAIAAATGMGLYPVAPAPPAFVTYMLAASQPQAFGLLELPANVRISE